MRVGFSRMSRIAAALAVIALLTAACSSSGATTAPSASAAPDATTAPAATTAPGGATQAPAAGKEVAVCELAYYTGEFAPYGPALTADVVFPIKEIINLDPPLGRPWVDYHEDLGTVGEAQAARTCLEKHGVGDPREHRSRVPDLPRLHDGVLAGERLAPRAERPRRPHPRQPRGQGGRADLPRPGPRRGPRDVREPLRGLDRREEGRDLRHAGGRLPVGRQRGGGGRQAPRPQGPRAHQRAARAAVVRGGRPEDRPAEPGRRHRPGGVGRVGHPDQAGGRGRASRSTGSARPGGARRSS